MDATRIKVAARLLAAAQGKEREEAALLRTLAKSVARGEPPTLHDFSRRDLAKTAIELYGLSSAEGGATRQALKGLAALVGKAAATRRDSWEDFLARHPGLQGR